jgi:hypothetical protein
LQYPTQRGGPLMKGEQTSGMIILESTAIVLNFQMNTFFDDKEPNCHPLG